MAARTPPFEPYPKWSQAKFYSFLRSALRRASSRWAPVYEAKALAKRPYKGPNKRQKFEYKCAKCKKYFPDKRISVDHIIPAGTLKDFSDLPGFCERLFCSVDGLQVLHDDCHKAKTALEKQGAIND